MSPGRPSPALPACPIAGLLPGGAPPYTHIHTPTYLPPYPPHTHLCDPITITPPPPQVADLLQALAQLLLPDDAPLGPDGAGLSRASAELAASACCVGSDGWAVRAVRGTCAEVIGGSGGGQATPTPETDRR